MMYDDIKVFKFQDLVLSCKSQTQNNMKHGFVGVICLFFVRFMKFLYNVKHFAQKLHTVMITLYANFLSNSIRVKNRVQCPVKSG